VTPTAFSSWPITSADAYASSADRPAPSAMLPGICVAGAPNRATSAPPSWSTEIWSGRWPGWASAAACSPFDSVATWAGSPMLSSPPQPLQGTRVE
jgi:hypothetical protein